MISFTFHIDNTQGDVLEGPQHGFGGRAVGRAGRIAGIQAGQFFVLLRQVTASHMLQEGQDAQSNREQAGQTCGPVIIFQVHGSQTERFALQAAEAVFHQVFFPVCEHSLLQGEHAFRAVSTIHPPSQTANRFLDGNFVSWTVRLS